MLSKQEIYDIYNILSVNFNEDYANKYVPLPMQYNDKKWKWEGKDFPRVISILEFREFMLEYNRTFNDVLSFNAIVPDDDPEFEYLSYVNRTNYNYDENEAYDIHTIDLDKKDFDFVMLNQTIEHLCNPLMALKNVYSHMCSGGMFYANVPANSIPHSTPFHFYMGITPVGLGALVKMAGFEILKLGQWGNPRYLPTSYNTVWMDYMHVPDPGYNDFGCPLISWCLAIKR